MNNDTDANTNTYATRTQTHTEAGRLYTTIIRFTPTTTTMPHKQVATNRK
jgi:hypothetical protein